jgi:hypothetical protein
VGLKTESGKVITASGVKPKVAVQWGRENFWIYGAIAPLSGAHFWHEYPKLNGECFQEFLDWLSQQLGEEWAILQVDRAPAHMTSAIRWSQNIIPLVQPAHSPELNPIERFWQLLKQPLSKPDLPFFASVAVTSARTVRSTNIGTSDVGFILQLDFGGTFLCGFTLN